MEGRRGPECHRVTGTREASSVSHATTRRPKLHIHAYINLRGSRSFYFGNNVTAHRQTERGRGKERERKKEIEWAYRRKFLTGAGPDSYPAVVVLTALIGWGCCGPIPTDRNLKQQSSEIRRVEATSKIKDLGSLLESRFNLNSNRQDILEIKIAGIVTNVFFSFFYNEMPNSN